MVRSCVCWCKHLIYALVVLVLIACLTEVGLRVYDSATGQVTRRDLYDRGLVCKSWSAHHSLKPSHTFLVRDPDSNERVEVAINSLGLRGPEPAIPKPADVFRILCLGDELTLAQQIPEAETYCARLQQEFPVQNAKRVEVLNAGVPDYCPLLSFLQMKHQLLGVQPDLVIINLEMGDVADDYQYRRQTVMGAGGVPEICIHPALEMKRRSAKAKTALTDRDEVLLLPQWCRHRLGCYWASQPLGDRSRSIDSAHCRYSWIEEQPPDWSVHIDQALTPVVQLRDLVGGFEARLVVAISPAPWQVSPDAATGEGVRKQAGVPAGAVYRSHRPFEIVAEFCRSHNLSFCDVSPAFQQAEHPERLYFQNAAALSSEGHALYARQLAEFLVRERRGPVPQWPREGGTPAELRRLPQARLPSR